MPSPAIFVRLSCLTGETLDDDDFVEPDDEPINPESEDDQQEK